MTSGPNNNPNNNNPAPQNNGSSADSTANTTDTTGTTYWYDGQPVVGNTITLPIDNLGLIRGATLFTTMRIHHRLDHPATQWDAHRDRLRHAITHLKFMPPNWDRIVAGVEYMVQHYPIVRIVVFPDGVEWVTGRSLSPDLGRKQTQGITVWVAPPDYQRTLPQYKSSSYLAPWLAAREGHDRNAEETILTNHEGHWLETATGNLWGYGEGQWWIPPLFKTLAGDRQTGQRLPGTSQNFMVQLLEDAGHRVTPRPWTPDWVVGLEAIAYSNSGVGLIPIRQVLDTQNNPIWHNPDRSPADDLLNLWKRAIRPESMSSLETR